MKDIAAFLTENFTIPTATSFDSRQKAVGLQRRVFFCGPTMGRKATAAI